MCVKSSARFQQPRIRRDIAVVRGVCQILSKKKKEKEMFLLGSNDFQMAKQIDQIPSTSHQILSVEGKKRLNLTLGR